MKALNHGVCLEQRSRVSIAVVLSLLVSFQTGALNGSGGSWTMHKGGSQGTSRTDLIGPGADASVLWTAETRAESGVTIGTNGDLYVGTETGLASLNPADGSALWSFDYTTPEQDTYATPALGGNGLLYGGSSRNTVAIHALDTQGNPAWSYPLSGQRRLISSPVIGPDSTVYVAVSDEGVHAINPDGTQKWFNPIDTYNYFIGSPALSPDGSQLYVANDTSALFAVDTSDGSTAWTKGSSGGFRSSPAIGDDGTIYIGGEINQLDAYSPAGDLLWRFFAEGSTLYNDVFSSPAIASDGTIVFTNTGYSGLGSQIYALNPDGTLRWQVDGYNDSVEYASPLIDGNDHIYINAYTGLLVYDLDGNLLWELDLPDSGGVAPPTIGEDGTLYLNRNVGNLTRGIIAIVPEPASVSLLAVGILASTRRRRL
jgi:outer membrane protein assembly factor BamB